MAMTSRKTGLPTFTGGMYADPPAKRRKIDVSVYSGIPSLPTTPTENPATSAWPLSLVSATAAAGRAARVVPGSRTNYHINYNRLVGGEVGKKRPDERTLLVFMYREIRARHESAKKVVNIIEMNRILDEKSRREIQFLDPHLREQEWPGAAPMSAEEAMEDWTLDGVVVGQMGTRESFGFRLGKGDLNEISVTVKGVFHTPNIWGRAKVGSKLWLLVKRRSEADAEKRNIESWPTSLMPAHTPTYISGLYRPFELQPWVGKYPRYKDLCYEDYQGIMRVGLPIYVGTLIEDDIKAIDNKYGADDLKSFLRLLDKSLVAIWRDPMKTHGAW